jgi:hypothetical protein
MRTTKIILACAVLTVSACVTSINQEWGGYLMWLQSESSPEYPHLEIWYVGSTPEGHFFRVKNHSAGSTVTKKDCFVARSEIIIREEFAYNPSDSGRRITLVSIQPTAFGGPRIEGHFQ